MGSRRAARLVRLGLLAGVLGMLLVAIGSCAQDREGVLGELNRVAEIEDGVPLLVFVYTDG